MTFSTRRQHVQDSKEVLKLSNLVDLTYIPINFNTSRTNLYARICNSNFPQMEYLVIPCLGSKSEMQLRIRPHPSQSNIAKDFVALLISYQPSFLSYENI